jgi:hypothetical protein
VNFPCLTTRPKLKAYRHSLSEAQAPRQQHSGIEALRGERYRLRLGQRFTSVGDPLRTPPKSLML